MLRICWLNSSQSRKGRSRMKAPTCAGCAPTIQNREEQTHQTAMKKTCSNSNNRSSNSKMRNSCSHRNDNRLSTKSRANHLRIESRCHQNQSSLIEVARLPKWRKQLSREAKVQPLKSTTMLQSIQQAVHPCHLPSTFLSCRWPWKKTEVCNSLFAAM